MEFTKKSKSDNSYWDLAERTSKQIQTWPEWKRNISLLDESNTNTETPSTSEERTSKKD